MDARRAVPVPVPVAALAAAALTAAALAAGGCGKSEIPSRPKPSYVSPGGEIRFWAPKSWIPWRGQKTSWHMRYRAGTEAAAEQRHAVAWLSAEYVPDRSDQPAATLFRLFVFTTAGYESLAAEPGRPAGTPIAAGAGRVLVASIPTTSPYDSGAHPASRYLAMRPTLDTLRAALRLAGSEAGTTAAWGADTVTYSIRLPAPDAPGRQIHARFAPDGGAAWITTYAGKGRPIAEKGRWVIRNGAVTVTFPDAGRGGPAGPLTYAIADSALVPLAWPAVGWGVSGAPLLVLRGK